jgi:hypothetical protein
MMHKLTDDNMDKPPLFRHWSGWYWLLIGWLAVLILLFYWLTIYLS